MKKYWILFLLIFPVFGNTADETKNLSFKLSIYVSKNSLENIYEYETIPLNGDGIYNLEPPKTVKHSFIYSKIIDNIHFSSSLEVSYSGIGWWVLISEMQYFDPADYYFDTASIAKAFFSQNTLNDWAYTGISIKKEKFQYIINYYLTPIDIQKEYQ